MKMFRTVLMAFCFCFVFNGTLAFSQNGGKPKDRLVTARTNDKRTDEKKVEPGDYFPENEFKSPFRYVIVKDDVQFDYLNGENEEEVPARRFVDILMEKRAFNKANLIYLFKYLSNYYADPLFLGITVHTSLMTLETEEERASVSTHSSRDGFQQFYRTAFYSRSNNIHELCSAGFQYDIGKPGKFISKYVNLTCTTKK